MLVSIICPCCPCTPGGGGVEKKREERPEAAGLDTQQAVAPAKSNSLQNEQHDDEQNTRPSPNLLESGGCGFGTRAPCDGGMSQHAITAHDDTAAYNP